MYRNLFSHIFGTRWGQIQAKNLVLAKYPDACYKFTVISGSVRNPTKTDFRTSSLDEQNVRCIRVDYLENDPHPYCFYVSSKFTVQEAIFFLDMLDTHVALNGNLPEIKDRQVPDKDLNSMKASFDAALKKFISNGKPIDFPDYSGTRDLTILFNLITTQEKERLLRFLAESQPDGIDMVLTINIDTASITQMERAENDLMLASCGTKKERKK